MGEFKTYFTHPKIEILALASGRVPILFTATKKVFFVDQKYTRNKRPKDIKKGVSIYMGVNCLYVF
jgi:hypothetical protein